ncbi:hypothetical protein SBD_6526 [Streptomyces bottropensis ATCC 25435]|uniref:Uncharacterized protein n=1 Tax=Streptomyces bottropensis ATCC 25435 TaxID=1054862 RepID=M3FGH7_9ACTN|nr:hypothetical protein SBD_6526 [Streptomyces bottropensis ATCC 25435]
MALLGFVRRLGGPGAVPASDGCRRNGRCRPSPPVGRSAPVVAGETCAVRGPREGRARDGREEVGRGWRRGAGNQGRPALVFRLRDEKDPGTGTDSAHTHGRGGGVDAGRGASDGGQ